MVHPIITHEHDGYFCQTVFMPEHIGLRGRAGARQRPHDGAPRYLPARYAGARRWCSICPFTTWDPEILLNAEQVLRWEEETGVRISEGDIVLFNFNWMRLRPGPMRRGTGMWNSPGMDESV